MPAVQWTGVQCSCGSLCLGKASRFFLYGANLLLLLPRSAKHSESRPGLLKEFPDPFKVYDQILLNSNSCPITELHHFVYNVRCPEFSLEWGR